LVCTGEKAPVLHAQAKLLRQLGQGFTVEHLLVLLGGCMAEKPDLASQVVYGTKRLVWRRQ
jgi:hypothetical protein